MSKVITFSTQYPKGHIAQGQPTYFIDHFFAAMSAHGVLSVHADFPWHTLSLFPSKTFCQKQTTIRKGYRWKEGEYFSPRIWLDIPYHSKQLQFHNDVQILNTYNIEYTGHVWLLEGYQLRESDIEIIAANDGLTLENFYSWFPKPFDGQLLSWITKDLYHGMVERISNYANSAVQYMEDDADDSDEDNFQCCENCDLPDACADFGCAIKQGIRKTVEW